MRNLCCKAPETPKNKVLKSYSNTQKVSSHNQAEKLQKEEALELIRQSLPSDSDIKLKEDKK